MKLALFGVHNIPLGKHNVKDSRLDQADELVEADKKTYAQVDAVGEKDVLEADAILTTRDGLPDLMLKDLEMVETRLGRNPPEAERAALLRIQAALESERGLFTAGLSTADLQAI